MLVPIGPIAACSAPTSPHVPPLPQLEYRNRFGDAVRAGLPDVTAMVRVRCRH